MDKAKIKDKLIEIIYTIFDNQANHDIDERTLLHIILSESEQALAFVCSIEDEFCIEFDDDEIDIEFFSNIDRIIYLLDKKIQ